MVRWQKTSGGPTSDLGGSFYLQAFDEATPKEDLKKELRNARLSVLSTQPRHPRRAVLQVVGVVSGFTSRRATLAPRSRCHQPAAVRAEHTATAPTRSYVGVVSGFTSRRATLAPHHPTVDYKSGAPTSDLGGSFPCRRLIEAALPRRKIY